VNYRTATSGFNTGHAHASVERQSTLTTKARREKRGRSFLRSLTIAFSRPFGHKPTAPRSYGHVTASDTVLGRRRIHQQTRMHINHTHDTDSPRTHYTRNGTMVPNWYHGTNRGGGS